MLLSMVLIKFRKWIMQRNVAHALINTTLDLDHRQKFSNIVYRGGYQMINHFKFRSDAMAMDPFAEFGTPGPVNEMVKNATEILKRNDIPSSPPVKATPPSVRPDTTESVLPDDDEILQ